MTAMALDPAGGGRDSAELASRYGGWYAPLVSAKGAETADGSATAATVVKHRRNKCPVVVDVGGGYGGAVMLRLKDNDIEPAPFNGANTVATKTKDGQLSFANKRAEAIWRFREALDPDQEGGSDIALPPDPELRADLCAPTWKLTARGILIESKDDLRKRLGRSPGKGDAVCMAWNEGTRAAMKLQKKAAAASAAPLPPRAGRHSAALAQAGWAEPTPKRHNAGASGRHFCLRTHHGWTLRRKQPRTVRGVSPARHRSAAGRSCALRTQRLMPAGSSWRTRRRQARLCL
jgi:hypothetical protein